MILSDTRLFFRKFYQCNHLFILRLSGTFVTSRFLLTEVNLVLWKSKIRYLRTTILNEVPYKNNYLRQQTFINRIIFFLIFVFSIFYLGSTLCYDTKNIGIQVLMKFFILIKVVFFFWVTRKNCFMR